MKKISLALTAFFTLTLNLFAQSDVSQSRWKSKEIVIDGVANEWNKPLNFYDDKTGLNFAICNDRHDLYFVFTCPDEMKMRKIMSAGWTVQLISKEKHAKFKASLTFPGIKMTWMGDRKQGNPMEKKIVRNPFINAYQSQISTIGVNGFLSNQKELRLNDRDGINIAIGADSLQHIVYEMAIPLKELFVENNMPMNELIILNITVNAMERPSSGGGDRERYSGQDGAAPGGGIAGMSGGRSGGGMGGGRSGMGGGRSGGGMSRGGMPRGGGSRGNSSLDRSGLFEKASFKQKFTLAGN